MAKDGYIKDYRKELESDIWIMPPIYHRVWQWIKYSVNHSEGQIPNRDGTKTELKPGQRATSYRQIAQGVGYYERGVWREPNVKTIKSVIDWLAGQKMISVSGNSNGTVVTVENWELYQSDSQESNSKRNAKSTLSKHSLDTNKNDKNDKNDNNKPPYPLTEFCFGSQLESQILVWLKYKSERKEGYKPIGLKSLLTTIKNKSSEYGEVAVINLIDECMAANWKGIIWDKLNNKPKPANINAHDYLNEVIKEGMQSESNRHGKNHEINPLAISGPL